MNTTAVRTSDADKALSVDALLSQADLIQDVIKRRMVQGQHYDVIPGTRRKALLKPGAELICLLFGLSSAYDVETVDYPGGHREVRVTCRLSHKGVAVAEGLGVCTTLETKYRYRSENTGELVPKEYWDTRDGALLGGPAYMPRKVDGKWFIFHQVETTNPADVYHTVSAMARKRAHVATTLSATAASDCFAPDADGDAIDHGKPASRGRHSTRSIRPSSTEAPIDPAAESTDRRAVLLAALNDAAIAGSDALMAAWQDLGEADRVLVGKDFGQLRKIAEDAGA